MDIRQSPQHGFYARSIGWIVEHVPSHDGQSMIQCSLLRIPLLNWHFAKIQRYETCPDEKKLKSLFRKYHVFSFSFEPGNLPPDELTLHKKLMKRLGAKINSSVYVPSATLWIDLRQPLEELRKRFDANARRLTRPQVHSDLTTTILPVPQWPIGTLRRFWEMGKSTNKHWHLTWGLFEKLALSYKDHAHLAISKDNSTGEWLCGILLLHTPDMLNYYQAWAGKSARNRGSHFWTVYQSLDYGQKLGCKTFDFEGMYDPRFPRESWQGFSRFKLKFGGTVIQFPGCFTRFSLLAPFQW